MIFGDRLDNDIAPAHRLGMRTVRVLRGLGAFHQPQSMDQRPDYTILNWVAVLVEHRLFSISTPGARKAKQYLTENFSINVNAYDLITGYRADDSYFDYAESFLGNAITVEQLSRAMRLGKLGEQICIKSKSAFSRIKYEGFEAAEKNQYYILRKARNDEANQTYLDILEEESDGLYIQDIIRGGVSNDDPRIPRNISK